MLCSLFLGNALQAQDKSALNDKVVNFGVKAGLNIANVWDSQGQDFRADAKVGFAGGLFLSIGLGDFLGVQPELLVSQKGFTASGTLLGSGYFLKRTTTYLDIPLQLQVKPADFMTILVGPQFSFLLHQQDVYTLGSTSIAQEQEFDNDNIRKNILGFVAGMDFNLSHVVFAPRVGWDLFNNNGDGTASTPRYKNRWVQLTLGFRI